ncbi:MAG TPA: hypothetical protein ENJ95_19225, partial [Bacteroidetes bacterium]|nr:hypothetical protein [Bacteroidota bacterium]
MKAVFTFLLLVSLFQKASSQNHDFYWPMGYFSFEADTSFGRTVLDFNTDPPQIYREDRELNFSATVASFCDSLGNLLVYTNGIRIVDSGHNLLENGDSLNLEPFVSTNYESGYRVAQSEIFLQKPDAPDTLMLFHESIEFDNVFGISSRYLLQTKIKLNPNNEQGSVISKNGELSTTETSYGGIRAVKHANGRDWWIFNSFQSQNKYNRFYLSPEGMIFLGKTELEPEFPFLYSSGYTAFSSDGSKFARFYIKNGVYIYNFNRCNGVFENPVFIPMPNTSLGGGISFSPNSRFLYIASAFEIFQFDLWAEDIGASLDTVAVYDGFQAPFGTNFLLMQLGPDGRIYINTT